MAYELDLKKACEVLGSRTPETVRKVAFEAALVRGFKNKERTAATTISKEGKVAARRLRDSLRRLEVVLKNPHLAYDLREDFQSSQHPVAEKDDFLYSADLTKRSRTRSQSP